MITPIIINRLQWKAYLIFMVTNFAFVPLVYFCYPETANLTLEEIDFLFTVKGKSATKLSKEIYKERKKHGAKHGSIVTGRRSSGAGMETISRRIDNEKKLSGGSSDEQVEQV